MDLNAFLNDVNGSLDGGYSKRELINLLTDISGNIECGDIDRAQEIISDALEGLEND
jgi:hypothetical protein